MNKMFDARQHYAGFYLNIFECLQTLAISHAVATWHVDFYAACSPQLHVFRLLNDLHLRLQLLILIYQLAVWWNHSLSGLLQQVTMLIYQWGNMDLFNSKKIISVLTKNYFVYSNPSLFACDLGYIEDYSDT
jgi:hypothetical protein